MVNEDGHSEVEMRCRIQQGANARGKVEGVMLDRNILKKKRTKSLAMYASYKLAFPPDCIPTNIIWTMVGRWVKSFPRLTP